MAATDALDASGNGGAGVEATDTAADAAGASGIAATLSIAPTPGAISGVFVGTLGATMARGAVDTMAGSAETDATGAAVALKLGVSDVTGLTDAVATEPPARSALVVVDVGRSVFTRLDCCASWTSAPVACWRFRSATSTVAFATALAWPECSEVTTSSESPTLDEEAPGAPYVIGAVGAFEAGAGVDEATAREDRMTATTRLGKACGVIAGAMIDGAAALATAPPAACVPAIAWTGAAPTRLVSYFATSDCRSSSLASPVDCAYAPEANNIPPVEISAASSSLRVEPAARLSTLPVPLEPPP